MRRACHSSCTTFPQTHVSVSPSAYYTFGVVDSGCMPVICLTNQFHNRSSLCRKLLQGFTKMNAELQSLCTVLSLLCIGDALITPSSFVRETKKMLIRTNLESSYKLFTYSMLFSRCGIEFHLNITSFFHNSSSGPLILRIVSIVYLVAFKSRPS